MERIRFGEVGMLRGEIGKSLTAEKLMELGLTVGGAGKVALGWAGGNGAAMLARALGAGICAAGGTVLAHDGCCAAVGSWIGEYYTLNESLFVEQEGERAVIHRFGQGGLSPDYEDNRILEQRWRSGCMISVEAGRVGPWEQLVGVNSACAADAARHSEGNLRGVSICVPGQGVWDQMLVHALERAGGHVVRREGTGVAAFSAVPGGFWLEASDENEIAVDTVRLMTLTASLELERGHDVAVPVWAPAVLEEVAADFGRNVLRLGQDKDARALYAATPQLRQAVFSAVYLVGAMNREGRGLNELLSRLPKFALRRVEIPLCRRGEEVMEEFTGHFRRAEPAGAGVRLQAGGGWVTVTPMGRRSALRLQTEGQNAEVAEELCGFYEEELRRLDTGR